MTISALGQLRPWRVKRTASCRPTAFGVIANNLGQAGTVEFDPERAYVRARNLLMNLCDGASDALVT